MRLNKLIFVMIISTLISAPLSTFAGSPLPTNIISLESPEGVKLFNESQSSPYFWRLNSQFISQTNQTYCSIASSVMVLNALKVEAPKDPTYEPYRMFTQDNFFTPDVKKVLPPELVRKQGATLKQISEALKTFHVNVKTYYANDLTIDKFRSIAVDTISKNRGYIIVNFLRTGLGEEGGGHLSPLAAYDKKADRFLMLDVARYRYPPIWVTTTDLWKGMNTIDADAKAHRGFVIVSQ